MWDGFACQEEQEQAHMEKVLSSEAVEGMISTLTSEKSMDLYCSFFEKVCVQWVRVPLQIKCTVIKHLGSFGSNNQTDDCPVVAKDTPNTVSGFLSPAQ